MNEEKDSQKKLKENNGTYHKITKPVRDWVVKAKETDSTQRAMLLYNVVLAESAILLILW